MRFVELARVSEQVAATSRRGEKTALLASVLRASTPEEAVVAVGVLTGRPRQGRIGVGWSALSKLDVPPADEPSLDVLEIDRWLSDLATESGAGSVARRRDLLRRVFTRATAGEQRLLWGVFSGELRQGALEGVMVDAIARGSGAALEEVRRAAMFSGDLGETARQAFTGGVDALRTVTLSPGRAVGPMLASPAENVADALAQTGTASVEWKLDGARVQAHRSDGDVRLFTRNLNEITDRLPGVVSLVAGLPGGDLVLDGEVAGLTEGLGGAQDLRLGGPRRFQDTMGDFSAQAAAGRGGGLAAYFFDVMHAGGAALIDEPLAARRDVLAGLVPAPFRLPSIVTSDADEATAFMDDAVGRGLEGVMIKALASSYAAGRRGGSWRRSSRCSPMTSWSSPPNGATVAAMAGCPTSISARAATTASSWSARRSRG
jgi:DNA ligase-1